MRTNPLTLLVLAMLACFVSTQTPAGYVAWWTLGGGVQSKTGTDADMNTFYDNLSSTGLRCKLRISGTTV